MKYLSLLTLIGCVKTEIIYVEKVIEVNNTNDIEIGIELQAWCEELRERKIGGELYSVEISTERDSLLNEVNLYFPWGEYPKPLEKCINELNF